MIIINYYYNVVYSNPTFMSMTIFEIADATARIDTVSQWGLIFSEVAVKKLFSLHLQSHEMFTQLMPGLSVYLCLGVPSLAQLAQMIRKHMVGLLFNAKL